MTLTLLIAIFFVIAGIANLARPTARLSRPFGFVFLALAALNFARFFELV